MGVINYAVYCHSKLRTILPWRIASVGPSSSFRNVFQTVVMSRVHEECESLLHLSLSEVFVGKSKDSLDVVDSDLNIDEVIPIFGPFVKYAVDEEKVFKTT